MLILSGDHIYKMNYERMLQPAHRFRRGRDLATIQIDPDEVSRFGVVDIDRDNRVNGFLEKPRED